MGCTPLDDLIIIAGTGHGLQDTAQGIDVCPRIDQRRAVFLFGCGVLVGTSHRIGIGVGIAEAQVDEFDIMPHACDHDIGRLEIEVHYLVVVQIADDAEQLTEEAVSMTAVFQVVRMLPDELVERLAVDILHQHPVVGT